MGEKTTARRGRRSAAPAESDLVALKCVYRRTRYRGDRMFTIGTVERADGGGEVTVKGTFVDPKPGDNLVLRGTWDNDARYGLQFRVRSVEQTLPSDNEGIVGFLDQLANVGRNRGVELVRKFGPELIWHVIEHEPERLCEVRGITRERALYIREQYMERKGKRDLIVFLKGFGCTDHKAALILDFYGAETERLLRENPYRLIEDVRGFGFLTTDELALAMGVAHDSMGRRRALLVHVLTEAMQSGDVCLPRGELMRRALKLVGPDCGSLDDALDVLVESGTLIRADDYVYLAQMRRHELSVAQRLGMLSAT